MGTLFKEGPNGIFLERTVYMLYPQYYAVEAPESNGQFNNAFEIQCADFYKAHKEIFDRRAGECHANLAEELGTIAEVRILDGNPNQPDGVFVQDIGWINAHAWIDRLGNSRLIQETIKFVQAFVRKPSRKEEPESFWDGLTQNGWAQGVRRIFMKHPIEGGDTTLTTTPLKGTRIIASIGQRNTRKGVLAFAKEMGLPLYIYELDENSGAFHVDVATRILADGTMIVCPEAFKGGRNGKEFKRFVREQAEYPVHTDEEINAYLTQKAIIVSLEDMKAYGINLLELHDKDRNRHLFVPAETPEERAVLVAELLADGATREEIDKILPPLVSDEYLAALKKTGCTIHKINMLPFIMAGGAIHCSTKTGYAVVNNTPCTLPNKDSNTVSARWGGGGSDVPDILLTDEDGPLQVRFGPNYNPENFPINLQIFLETVTCQSIDQKNKINPEERSLQDEAITLPPLYEGAPSIKISVKEERWDPILWDLYAILEGGSVPLPETVDADLFHKACEMQRLCRVGGR